MNSNDKIVAKRITSRIFLSLMMKSKEMGVDYLQRDYLTEYLLFLNDWNARATRVGGLILSFPRYLVSVFSQYRFYSAEE